MPRRRSSQRGSRGGARGGRNQLAVPTPVDGDSPSSGEETEEMEVDSDNEAQEEEEEAEQAEDSSDEEQEEPAPSTSGRGGLSSAAAAATEFVIDSSDPLISTTRNAMENTIQFVKDIIPHCYTEEKLNNVLERLKKLMLGYIKTETSYIQGQRIVAKLGDELPQLGDNATEQEIISTTEHFGKHAIEKVNENRSKIREDSLKKHKNYTRLLNEIKLEIGKLKRKNAASAERLSVEDDGSDGSEEEVDNVDVADLEDEDDETSEMIPTTDPITKQPLTDPVRNRLCGHIYGKAAMLELIKANRKIRCTTAGCANKAFVTKGNLLADPELTRKVAQKIKEASAAERRRHRRRRGADDDTEEL